MRTFVLVSNFLKSTSPLTQKSIALAVVRTATWCFRLVGQSEGAQYTVSLVNPFAVTWNGGVVLSNVPTSRQSTSRKSDTRSIGRCPDELDARSFQG